MDLKTFLEKNNIINKAELASLMWPENKNGRIKLHNKLNEIKAGSGTQRLTEKDLALAKEVLKKLCENINNID